MRHRGYERRLPERRSGVAVTILAVIRLDAATVLLQWATGGMLFCWFTTRHRIVGLGYGWLFRGTYFCFAAGAFAAGIAFGSDPIREDGLCRRGDCLPRRSRGLRDAQTCGSLGAGR